MKKKEMERGKWRKRWVETEVEREEGEEEKARLERTGTGAAPSLV